MGAHLAGRAGERRAPFPRVDEAGRRPRPEREEMAAEKARWPWRQRWRRDDVE